MTTSAPTLTREEFVSLRDGAKGLMHRIPSEHKARLIELEYIARLRKGCTRRSLPSVAKSEISNTRLAFS